MNEVIVEFPFLLVLLILLSASQAKSEEAADCNEDSKSIEIAGVWQLVEASTQSRGGEVQYPYGQPPAGLFIYTPGGHLSLQLHKNPPRKKFDRRPSDSELGTAARDYIGYFGTWSISGNSVFHHIGGAMLPNRLGQDAERPYTLCGNTLELRIKGRDGQVLYRRLERIETFSQ